MGTRLSTYLLSCLVALMVVGCGAANDEQPQSSGSDTFADSASSTEPADEVADVEVADVEVATDFTMKTLTGEEVTLSSLNGQIVLVNFWATWCVPCREEMPYFQALADEHSDGLVVLGVNMREEAERIQPFIDEMGLTFPILLDPPNELISEHNVRGLPVSYVVGPEGTVVYRRIGEILPEEFDPWLDEQLMALQSK